MARSYQSALPTWSTYTPHISPMGIQAAINAENWWGKGARQFQPTSIHGWLGRTAGEISGMVKGTGAGAVAAQLSRHQPLLQAMTQAGRSRADQRRNWSARMQEALHQNAPERMTAESENEPQTPVQVRASHTAAGRGAPPTVNPTAVVQQRSAQQLSETLTAKTLESEQAGGSTIKINDRRKR